MKKLYAMLLSFAVPMLISAADVKTVPYASNLALTSSELDSDWIVEDANGDSNTWMPGREKGYNCAIYSWAADKANDWLISPGVALESGKEYNMTFKMFTGGYTEAVKAYMASSSAIEAFTATAPLASFEGTQTTPITLGGKITVPADGIYYFGIQACSPVDQYKLYVYDFMVVERVFAPAPVTGLVAERGADKELKVTLSWTLPTTDVLGTPLSDSEDITAVNIYRDGSETPIAVLDGYAADYEDNAAGGLTPGVHTYQVSVTAAGVESAKVSVTTEYVGSPDPAPLPFSTDFSRESNMDMWTSFKGENAAIAQSPDGYGIDEWKWSEFAKYAYIAMREGQQDHYMVAPPIRIDHAGTYRMTVKLATNTQQEGPEVEFLLGHEPTKEGLATVIKDGVVPPYQATVMSTYPLVTVDFKVDEPGDYYVGMHMVGTNLSASDYNPYYYYYVYNCAFEEITVVPSQITEVSHNADESNPLAMTFSWTAPETTSSGDQLNADDFSVVITRNGATVATVPGEQTSYTDVVDMAGFYTYTLSAVGNTGLCDGEPVTFTDLYVGDNALDLPYIANFDRAPERDMWTVIDANNDGYTWEWSRRSGTNRLVLHQAPAPETGDASADKTGTETTEDNRVFISDNDYVLTPLLHFEAGDYMLNYQHTGFIYNGDDQLESSIFYEVGLVAEGDHDAEGANLQQQERRNVDVDYLRQAPVYRFNVATPGKYHLAIAAVHSHTPTIAYGYLTLCDVRVEADSSSALDMPASGNGIIVNGNLVSLPDGASEVKVTDMSGRTVMALREVSQLDLSSLPAGVYVVSAIVDGRMVVAKVIIP